MRYQQPIYTEKAECQDCYKCVRKCPVKAIRIKDHSAMVMPEHCIHCGTCVNVCPVGAKRVREELERVTRIISEHTMVVASVAPSWVSEFPQFSESQFISVLKQLGFSKVSETALGADEVSNHVVSLLNSQSNGIFVSSACPTAVLWIEKYFPKHAQNITPLLSPALAHTKLLKKSYGENTKVVFIGPCIAKKTEADKHPELLECALTFEDLRLWFQREGITPDNAIEENEVHDFEPQKSSFGVLYPMDGGMIRSMLANHPESNAMMMSFSGFEGLSQALTTLENETFDNPLFLELLACEGGCINGPKSMRQDSTIKKRLRVESESQNCNEEVLENALDINEEYHAFELNDPQYDERDIRRALYEVGKTSHNEELNCGGCGYNSCREFAKALLLSKAEPAMCVSYMRKMASKKANALLKAMPAGVVIVDSALKIVECNHKFSVLMGEQSASIYENVGTLEGISMEKLVDFADQFSIVLHSDEALEKQVRFNGKVIQLSLFPIESHQLVGAIFQDVTQPAVKKEQIINKTREVINKHLTTVQQIACLLGENAAESEVLLNSIIEMYSVESGDSEG
jgi:iron only hydrogenase large subunit-like protein